MTQPAAQSAPPFRIPRVIKRNITLFALSQTFTGAGMQLAYGLGPLMVLTLTGSSALTGLSMGLIGLSRFLVAYPVGKITDTYGRKPGILLGLALAMVGAVIVGLSMSRQSYLIFAVGLLIFGMGMNAAQQLRVAATDMFPSHHRAQALGYVALGSLVGLLVSPAMVAFAEALALDIGHDPLGLPWLLLPALIIPGMALVFLVRPDPKEIGMNLGDYYPGYAPAARPGASHVKFRAMVLLRNAPIRYAIVSNLSAQGNMSIVMVLTALVLASHGHSLAAIAFAYTLHAMGMFAFTVPLGRLADRVGREAVMIPGVTLALFGAGMVAFTEGYWPVTIGTFLVGIGWAAANVAATAMIADHAATHERGRAIGVNDSFAGGISVVMAVVTGPLIEWAGLPATGFFAVLVAVPPPLMLLSRRLRRRQPSAAE